MKIWMTNGGENLNLTFSKKTLDLRNTSQDRPVEVNFDLGRKLLLPGIVFGQLTEKEAKTPEGKELLESGKVLAPMVKKEIQPEKVEETVEDEIVKSWENYTYHEKKKFANANDYEGENFKEETLDNWYKKFISQNEI